MAEARFIVTGEMGPAGIPEGPVLRAPIAFVCIFCIAVCGLLFELVAGTLAGHLLGASAARFGAVIGVGLAAGCLGASLSTFIHRGLARRLVDLQSALALAGGFSAPLLFLAFPEPWAFRVAIFALPGLIGVLTGLEMPLLARLLRPGWKSRLMPTGILAGLGALVAALLFPLLLLPRLGLVRTSLAFGLLNGLVALGSTLPLRPFLGPVALLRLRCAAVLALLIAGVALVPRLTLAAEEARCGGEILFALDSPYQRILLAREPDGFGLYLDGALQFSSADEYRFHEALVHPAFSLRPLASRVLVLGGGDGMAVREILRHPEVQEIVLVDPDPALTGLAMHQPLLCQLNGASLLDSRVRIVHADPLTWLAEPPNEAPFELAILDLPDPWDYARGKFYTTHFYGLLRQRMTPTAVAALQGTSPLASPRAFWCIDATLAASGFRTLPYHLTVPSLGEWGFLLASPAPLEPPRTTLPGLRCLSDASMAALFAFPRDMERRPSPVNRLDDPVLVRLVAAGRRNP